MYKQQAIDLLKGTAVPGAALWVFLGVTQLAMADTGRWYTQDQVARGAGIFTQNCAECHGANAEATQNWREPNADGSIKSGYAPANQLITRLKALRPSAKRLNKVDPGP